jgi:hypothetical protein
MSPGWPHFWLLTAAFLGSAAVAWGIIREAENVWSLTTLLVVGGVAIEAICTLLLFEFDKGISGAQQSELSTTLSALNDTTERLRVAEMHLPDRQITFDDWKYFQNVASSRSSGQKLSIRFPEGNHEAQSFAGSIGDMLQGMYGWKPIVLPFCEAPFVANPANGPVRKCPVGPMMPGIWGPFGGDPKNKQEESAKGALFMGLDASGFCIGFREFSDLEDKSPDVITLVVGPKNIRAPNCK